MVKKGVCGFYDCKNEVRAKGLCHGHYQQQHAGKVLSPLREKTWVYKDAHGRVCTECDRYKEWDHYYDMARSKCKPCVSKINNRCNQNRRELESDPLEPKRAREIA